ncbi:MAG: cyclic nucleotide-binding domain-containing protein [Acidobacteria bacterium]|jgi:CRP-like cAMP-binding protein|nr:cyclic nucleotide-binding domain-containing protein [Acidobacteriota bacterium]
MERLLHLRTLPVIGTLGPEDLGLVAEQARTRVFETGDRLLRQGEPIAAVHIVVEGRVHLQRGDQVLGHATPGAGVGGLGYLARDPNGIDAVAETDVVALELDGDMLDEILEDRFRVLQHVLRETSRGLIDLWHEAPRECLAAQVPMRAPGFKSPLDLVQRMLFLREGLPFIRASASALADLSRGLVELRFEPGTVLFRRGEPGRQVQMLVEGRVACSSPIEGFGLQPGPGYPLGGLEAVAGVPRWYDAVCETPVVALSGNAEILFDLFEDNSDVALAYLAQIARVQLDALERIAAAGRESSLLPFFGGNLEA